MKQKVDSKQVQSMFPEGFIKIFCALSERILNKHWDLGQTASVSCKWHIPLRYLY